jgi:hypothetical protein
VLIDAGPDRANFPGSADVFEYYSATSTADTPPTASWQPVIGQWRYMFVCDHGTCSLFACDRGTCSPAKAEWCWRAHAIQSVGSNSIKQLHTNGIPVAKRFNAGFHTVLDLRNRSDVMIG